MVAGAGVTQPFDLVRLSISERVCVKLRGDREVRGILHAYDGHMNLIMGDVEETIYDVQIAEDTGAETIKVNKRNSEMLFVRGDGVILEHSGSHLQFLLYLMQNDGSV
ncbi:Lsm3p [Malassezia vespertilionis]|uniref:LSM complex subunit LSM3 n=1 Tax=Malassezia vespertilionis TaxID=2020962 RepID=A0A2N1JDU6_9BASI|nr:Lsm3p [Malassezia vespertilionis]